MSKKKSVILMALLVLAYAVYQFVYYNLPLKKLPLLDDMGKYCTIEVLPVYKGLEQDTKARYLSTEEMLELKAFLQDSTFSRLSPRDGIRIDSDTTYRITVTWSEGHYLQIRTFGDNPFGSDILAWDTGGELLLLQAHDENWFNDLEKILVK